jgi:hypothetical protein
MIISIRSQRAQCLSFLSLPLGPARLDVGKARARAASHRSIFNPIIPKPLIKTRRSGCTIPSNLYSSPRLASDAAPAFLKSP